MALKLWYDPFTVSIFFADVKTRKKVANGSPKQKQNTIVSTSKWFINPQD